MARTEEPYCALIGTEGNERLIIAESENWTDPDETAKIGCSKGFVDLAEWR